ncbi:hypothetical protein vBRpoSV10_214 [Ruegeria phage vB_RpoS-V10]|nr:hypothetical protein DSS3P8_209 [Roseobacter phage DSS3P8]AWY09336.1 hypothetical protein vBRpoSV10_214 [Ruegeria phage vB_RpoS-V10]
MGIGAQLETINAANKAIRAILDAALATILRDLEGKDPSKYTLYDAASDENGLYILEDGRVVLQSIESGAWGDFGPQVSVPMSVLDDGTLDEWIVAEKARREEERLAGMVEAARLMTERNAARLRIFRGEVS